MAKIVLCWELGAGFGHLFRLYPIGNALIQAGHQVILASKALKQAETLFKHSGVVVIPAPFKPAPATTMPLSLNYAQNLLKNGYWHQLTLTHRLKEWLLLFERHQPDFVLAEHAPTALLASQILSIPRGATGTGFSLPPLRTPMPGIQPWFDIPDQQLLTIENDFLSRVNPVMNALSGKQLSTVADIFSGTERFLCAQEDLDHYADRKEEDYLGPVIFSPENLKPVWPSAGDKKVFVYLHRSHRLLRRLLNHLKNLDVSVLAVLPGMSQEEQKQWSQKSITIAVDPVDLSIVAKDCDLLISQGGMNTGTRMLLQGIPVLMLPLALEQMLWTFRLSRKGLAASVSLFSDAKELGLKLNQVLGDETLAETAKRFSKKNAGYNTVETVNRIARQCLKLIQGKWSRS